MSSVGYTTMFDMTKESTKFIGDNEEENVGPKRNKTTSKTARKKIHGTRDNSKKATRLNNLPMEGIHQEGTKNPSHMDKGRATTSMDGSFVHNSHKSSSSHHKARDNTSIKRESNEECAGDGYIEGPPQDQLEVLQM